jgi:aminoglycoside phosphotransferase (APT) family kinase protein
LNAVTVSYSTIKAVSKPNAIAELVANELIAPMMPSVQVKKVRTREGRRFEAPKVMWNVYDATLELPGGIEAKKLFWTKAYFDDAERDRYQARVNRLIAKQNGNPLDPGGHVHFFNDLNMFLFFFPADPVFPALGMFFDPAQALPLLAPHFEHLRPGASITGLRCELVKYLPEISLIVRFDAEVGEERPLSIYGKFQHSRRGQLTYDVMRALWELPARAKGDLVVAEPLGYYPQYDLLLQSALPGEEIPGDRHADLFMEQCAAAGRTLGHIHNSAITVGTPHTIDTEIGRLRGRLEEFKMSGPQVYMLLRSLLNQIAATADRIPPEAPVASHGDYKYNQFLYDGTNFGLIDVEYFVQAEPSFDLGKYCGHLAPSMPKHWSDTAQADEARRVFLQAYCEVRPEYRGARFNLYESLSLATRALVVLWSQPRNWQYTAETLIALAFERLKTRWGE